MLQRQIAGAADPRDKLYALYGIFSQVGFQLPEPDYRKSIADIYKEATVMIIKHEKSLRILRLVDGSQGVPGLVSWVPDYREEARPFAIEYDEQYASKKSRSRFEFSDDYRQLHLAGQSVDMIRTCSSFHSRQTKYPRDSREAHFVELIRAYQDWMRMAQQLATYPTGENMREVIISTMLQEHWNVVDNAQLNELIIERNQNWTNIIMANDRTSGIGLDALDNIINANETRVKKLIEKRKFGSAEHRNALRENPAFLRPNPNSTHPEEEKIYKALTLSRNPIWTPVASITQDATFYVTENGYVGLGNPACREGDKIVLVAGICTPVIMRREGGFWHFIGHAYIHGMMVRELWPGDDAELEDFTLV